MLCCSAQSSRLASIVAMYSEDFAGGATLPLAVREDENVLSKTSAQSRSHIIRIFKSRDQVLDFWWAEATIVLRYTYDSRMSEEFFTKGGGRLSRPLSGSQVGCADGPASRANSQSVVSLSGSYPLAGGGFVCGQENWLWKESILPVWIAARPLKQLLCSALFGGSRIDEDGLLETVAAPLR